MLKEYFPQEDLKALLVQGAEVWNAWRAENPNAHIDLRDMDFGFEILQWPDDFDFEDDSPTDDEPSQIIADNGGSKLDGVDLRNTYLIHTKFYGATLINANFEGAHMHGTDFQGANLTQASFENSNLTHANLAEANLTGANLKGAELTGAALINANLTNASLDGARIYGISAWDINKEGTSQKELIITPKGEPEITVDDLEIAQFIYLLLNNQKFRDVIESVTSKAVLILGRFTEERKHVLDAIRDELRTLNYLPILFDFVGPTTRDVTETVSILAKLSRFVIADLTDPKSIPQELTSIIPNTRSLPIMPLILQGQREYAMYEHWRAYPWVLPIYEYENEAHLIATLPEHVIGPAERKVQEIRGK